MMKKSQSVQGRFLKQQGFELTLYQENVSSFTHVKHFKALYFSSKARLMDIYKILSSLRSKSYRYKNFPDKHHQQND